MKKNVYFTQTVSICVEMEVSENDTKDEIIEKSYDKFQGLIQFCGNNSYGDKLVGTSHKDVTIELMDDYEFDEITEE